MAESKKKKKNETYKSGEGEVESYSLKPDPTYDDVIKVFNKLDPDDRANLVPRHPDFFRKVPDDMLFDRQVAIDSDGNPVGFNEFYYGKNKLGRRQPPHNSIAVVPEARGNGLARLMVEEAIRKARKEKIKRLVWEAFADNEGSIHAALSSGFEDATPKNAKGYRRLVYRVSDEKTASDMSRDRIKAQYARHPQESLDRLVTRLAHKKWGIRDVAREDAAHAEEFGVTGEDKEYLDRYIIARIAEKYDRKARLKQAIMRRLWEKGHDGESFDAALPARMARFRQYEDSPFGKYSNPVEQAKYDEWASKSDEDMDGEWNRYLSAR